MDAFLIYIVKVSGILSLFYLNYQLFLKKETFFAINRHFLLVGILLAFLLPLITINNYIGFSPITLPQNLSTGATNVAIQTHQINWGNFLFFVYITGATLLFLRYCIHFASLYSLIRKHKVERQGKFHHVEIRKNIAPFSFFNYIFYNPQLYSNTELSAIIEHEKTHGSQWHSLDVLLSHALTICTWINPFSWLYQANIKQNLEFLADEGATKKTRSLKNYQYALLKVSGNPLGSSMVNTFYNSLTRRTVLGKIRPNGLVKKRIVMLNKSKSNKKKVLKVALIFPALTLFMLSFNTRDIYVPIDNGPDVYSESYLGQKTIEVKITKNTTEKELLKIKKNLSEKGLDFSYTVVRNADKEIIDIYIDFAAKKKDGKSMKSSSSFNNGDQPIDPIHIIYDAESNSISMGSMQGVHVNIHEDKTVHTDVDTEIHEETDHAIWIHSDEEDGKHVKTIEIIEEDGIETIKVDGKKVTREELEKLKEGELQEKRIKIRKRSNGEGNLTFILKDSDDDTDIEVVSEKKGFFFIDNDEKEAPLYIIDGKEAKQSDVEKLKPDTVQSMQILKDEKAKEKYGKKGKNGVIEITTKKEKN